MQKQDTLISIVMLNYNGLEYLKKTILPILELDYPNFEFIIVDNGSTDGSIEYIKKFQSIKLIENVENLGYSKGKNIGVKEAMGEYVLLLDSDILIQDKKFLKEILFIVANRSVGFVQVPLVDVDKKKTHYYGTYTCFYGLNMHLEKRDIKTIMNYEKKSWKISGPTGGLIFVSKKNWETIGGFDESQGFHLDDVDIGPRAILFGYDNIVWSGMYAIHLGINRTCNLKVYCNRFKYIFSGHARAMIKNYRFINLLWAFPVMFGFQFIKAIRYSFKKRSLGVFIAFLKSFCFFIKNLSDTLKERKKIQSKRVVKEDVFLKIKPPKFD